MKTLTIGKKIALPTVEDVIKIVNCFLVSRAALFGVFPYGMALWAAVLEARGMYLGVFGVILGVVSAGGDWLKYLMAVGFYMVYTYVRKDKTFNSLFCGLFVFISGVISTLSGGQSPVFLIVSAVEGVVAAVSYILSLGAVSFFDSYRGETRARREEIISLTLLCGIILMGFSGLYVTPQVRLSISLGIYIVMVLSKCIGMAAAGSVGLVLGFISGTSGIDAVLMMGIFGISALSANFLREYGKTGTIVGFFIGELLCIICIDNYIKPLITIYETLISAMVFALTPKSLFMKVDACIAKAMQGASDGKEVRVKEYLSGELKNLAKAFSTLAESFLSLSGHNKKMTNASDMFDRVAERVCSSCNRWGECWIDGYSDMHRYMYDILDVIEKNGYCDIGNMPIVLKEKCNNPDNFISEFNHFYEMYKQSTIWHGEVNLGQDMVARQYHEISNLISGISDELESGFSFVESAELKLDTALEKIGYFAREINVIENSKHEPEVYISAGETVDSELLERIVSETVGVPMKIADNSSAIKFVAHNRYYVEYAVCQHSGEAEELCGDTVMQFETNDSKFCVLLCDGMGAGDEANEESRLTASLFGDFIKAGFIKDTAVRMINSTLAMKSGNESFSTIDLIEIDLRSGQTEFLKVGAAESFLLQKGKAEIIYEKALPVGIVDDVQAPLVSRKLQEGDVIVMVSDGISETGYGAIRGEWVSRLIEEHDGDMQELADAVLKNARGKAYPKPCDDMTVAAMRIKRVI